MKDLFLFRGLSLLLLVLSYRLLPPNGYYLVIGVTGLAHYVASAIYSKKIFLQYLGGKEVFLLLPLLILSIYFSVVGGWSLLVLLFGVHHLFTEVYAPDSLSAKRDSSIVLAVRFLFHALAYVLIVRSLRALRFHFLWPSMVTLGIVAIVYFSLMIFNSERARREKEYLLAAETVILLFVAASFWFPLGFMALLYYHFLFWLFFPLTKLRAIPAQIRRYVWINVLALTSIALLSYGADRNILSAYYFRDASVTIRALSVLGYYHILTSLALSRLNPLAVRRVFIDNRRLVKANAPASKQLVRV